MFVKGKIRQVCEKMMIFAVTEIQQRLIDLCSRAKNIKKT